MYLSIHADGGVSIHEADDCGRLHLTVSGVEHARADAALRAAGVGEMHGTEHAYLDLEALHALARAASTADGWAEKWQAMVDYARAKGWIGADGRSVRVHVER